MPSSYTSTFLRLLIAGQLGLLTSCSNLSSSDNTSLATTFPSQSTGKTLTYNGFYQPALGQRMREKMLDSYASGNPAKARSYQALIGTSQRLKVRVQRELTSSAPSFTDSVIAYEGTHSKELKKDQVVFDAMLLNTPKWKKSSRTYANIPLDQIRTYRDLNSTWQVIGPAGTRTVAQKTVNVTKVIYTEKLDDYNQSRSEFLLSNQLPGRIATYQNYRIKNGKSQPHISVTLQSFQ